MKKTFFFQLSSKFLKKINLTLKRKTVSRYQISSREVKKTQTLSVRFTLDCKEQVHDRKQNSSILNPPLGEIYNQPSQPSGLAQDKKLFKARHPNSI